MTTVQATPNGYIILVGTIEPEDHLFTARCAELCTASCAETVEEALDNLDEAVAVLLESLVDIGTLERELSESGIAVHTGPLPADTDAVTVAVPIGKIARVYIHQVPVPALAAV